MAADHWVVKWRRAAAGGRPLRGRRTGDAQARHRRGMLKAMARLLAVVFVLLLTAATSSDLVSCPDGCTDGVGDAPGAVTASICPLCQAWSAGPTLCAASPVLVRARREPVPAPAAYSAYHPAIEHPPKRA
jgi:hypothetical protein